MQVKEIKWLILSWDTDIIGIETWRKEENHGDTVVLKNALHRKDKVGHLSGQMILYIKESFMKFDELT